MGLKTRRSLPGLGVVRSAAVSMRHVFERKKTVQYPDDAPAVGFRFRGRHIFHQDVCIGCTQCERVCPVIAIKMETHKDPTSRKVVTDRFALDLGICYYCGLCEEVCPTDPKAIHLGPDFELATHDRRLLIYEMGPADRAHAAAEQAEGPRRLPWPRPPRRAPPPHPLLPRSLPPQPLRQPKHRSRRRKLRPRPKRRSHPRNPPPRPKPRSPRPNQPVRRPKPRSRRWRSPRPQLPQPLRRP